MTSAIKETAWRRQYSKMSPDKVQASIDALESKLVSTAKRIADGPHVSEEMALIRGELRIAQRVHGNLLRRAEPKGPSR